MASSKTSIGYLLSLAVAEQVFMGGAMVTDTLGLPQEFRYTEPIRATKLQRILYGDVLERYIHVDVILVNLLERLEQKPTVFVVSDSNYLHAVAGKARIGIWAAETRAAPLKEIGTQQDVTESEFLLQVTASGGPMRIRCLETDAALRGEAVRTLVDAAKTMDVLEPARRIEAAIRLIWEETPETLGAQLVGER